MNIKEFLDQSNEVSEKFVEWFLTLDVVNFFTFLAVFIIFLFSLLQERVQKVGIR